MPRLPVAIVTVLCCAWVGVGARSHAHAEALPDVLSTIGLARVADELGDAELGRRLKSGDRDAALVAARAAAFAYAPERLIPGLAELACGRDPVLAPESARVLFDLAERLRGGDVLGREVVGPDLERARAALGCRAQGAAPRADIVFALTALDEALQAFLGDRRDPKQTQ